MKGKEIAQEVCFIKLRLGPRLRDICGFWSLLEIMLEKEYNSAQIFYVASFDVASQTPP